TLSASAQCASPILDIVSLPSHPASPCWKQAAGPGFRTRPCAAAAAVARPAKSASSRVRDVSRLPIRWSASRSSELGLRHRCALRVSSGQRPISPSSRWFRRERGAVSSALRFDAAVAGGRELQIAAMFVDLRESTRLATGRLPFDALFIFDRYIQAVTQAIRRNGGHATSIAGDGVMSVFGVDEAIASAARNAFQAALEIWNGLEILSAELADELRAPLRVGIGVHVGLAV